MSAWVVILVTAVIAALITALFFTVKGNINMQKELYKANADIFRLTQNENRNMLEIKSLEKSLSFQEGMRLARKTDTLYQQILKKCSDKERFTVMMNGTQEGDMK